MCKTKLPQFITVAQRKVERELIVFIFDYKLSCSFSLVQLPFTNHHPPYITSPLYLTFSWSSPRYTTTQNNSTTTTTSTTSTTTSTKRDSWRLFFSSRILICFPGLIIFFFVGDFFDRKRVGKKGEGVTKGWCMVVGIHRVEPTATLVVIIGIGRRRYMCTNNRGCSILVVQASGVYKLTHHSSSFYWRHTARCTSYTYMYLLHHYSLLLQHTPL